MARHESHPGTTNRARTRRVNWAAAFVVAVLVLATFIRSAFGFGEALVAVPLLALLMPVDVAAPVAVLVSITVAVIVVVQDWRAIHVRSAARLVVATMFGTPIGLLLLTLAPEPAVKAVLGIIIAAFSTYSLAGGTPARLSNDRLAWVFGFAGGVLGGAYGMNGPPLVVFGALRGWSPQHFRATLQGYFLPASMLVLAGYWLTGLWTRDVTHYYLLAFPWIVGAVLLGRAVNRRLEARSFLRYVHAGLIVIGLVLLFQAFGHSP
jgi:uncharacterized membrane protein YfcA